MAKLKSIYSELEPKIEQAMITGELVFSRIVKKYTPSAEIIAKSKYDKGDPRYTITVKNAKITKGTETSLGKALADDTLNHGLYKNKKGEVCFSIESRSMFPIQILTRETGADSLPANELLENELAPGQEVDIILSTYKNKTRDEMGISFDGVVIESPENIRYYQSGANFAELIEEPESKSKLSDFRKKPSKEESNQEEPTVKENTDYADTSEPEDLDDLFD